MVADAHTLLASGAQEIVPADGLREKLASGRPLRVKFGVDPSRPDLTLGHAVVLRKLRQFQDLGHVAILIIGDFTGMVGDPSGRSETRPMLTPEQMKENAHSYFEQAKLVLDTDAADVRWNSEWLGSMDMPELLRLASSATVAQMLDREDFRARHSTGKPISIVEFLYPLLQARDSVAVEADIELGGSDQLFNLLMGREIQRAWGQEPQVVLTMPLLEGTDGVRKMSKSYDNYVGLTEPPEEMFGKLMSIPDTLIAKYLSLCTPADPGDVGRVSEGLANGSLHPNQEKRRLAREIVDLYHGPGAGAAAEERFNQVFRSHDIPADVPEMPIPATALRDGRVWLPKLLVGTGLASSNGEARRAVQQGGVRLDGNQLADPEAEFEPSELHGKVLQVGRRQFVRLRAQ
ncbi:MAG: tyrosyl-tRNA synthetase [Actinomycetota bacterium]|nr:tyrosyl-tRNA synthetase [Actinomycetota bacterium]